MRISWSDIYVLYRRELRSAFRESNILLYSVLVPLLLYPLMVWLMMSAISFVSGQQEESVSRVVLSELPDSHRRFREVLEASEKLKLVEVKDGQSALRSGRIDLLVIARQDDYVLHFQVFKDSSRDASRQAFERFQDRLKLYREIFRAEVAGSLGLQAKDLQPFWLEGENQSSPREVGRYLLGVLLPFTLIVILSIGGMYPAIDSTAGERERGTWETLMTCSTARVNLVLAKYFYVCTLASLAAVLNLAAMLFSMRSIIAPLSRDLAASISFTISPSSVLVILLGSVLMAMVVASGMMILASFARSFREGQALVTPAFMLALLPITVVSDSSLRLTLPMAVIPVVNVALMWREAIHGHYPWGLIMVTLLVQLICLALCVLVATRILAHEDMVLGTYGGNFWNFVKDRLFGRERS